MTVYSTQADNSVVVNNKARFSALSSGLVRMEFSDNGVFEDRPSIRCLTRPVPVTFTSVEQSGSILVMDTGAMKLHFEVNSDGFNPKSLWATRDSQVFWRYGQVDKENLGGVHLSMDCVNRHIIPEGVHEASTAHHPNGDEHILWGYRGRIKGGSPENTAVNADNYDGMSLSDVLSYMPEDEYTEAFKELLDERSKYPPGILSRSGYFLFNDSIGAVMDADSNWLAPRCTEDGAEDLYLFSYGKDFRSALKDYCSLCGYAPMIPRYSMGSWYSRYPTFNEEGLRELIADYEKHDLPLDALVLDLEWHQRGWYGFDWDTNHIQDPDGFLEFLREQNIHTTFNIHPNAVPVEDSRFQEFIEQAGVEFKEEDTWVDRGTRVFGKYDTAIKQHADAFMDVLHKPVQDQGVDFWWMDGSCPVNPVNGVDPQMWTNHVYKTHLQDNFPGRRPMVFTRTSGLGSHRYPFHFTGDACSQWEALKSQVEYTLRAGHIGQSYMTHDIGGHLNPYVNLNPELYSRWVQWGVLSPIFRLHSSGGGERRPYVYEERVLACARNALRLRMELLPYLYNLAHETAITGMPICRSNCLELPEWEAGYSIWDSYFLGDRIYATPILEPGIARDVTLPKGEWYRQNSNELNVADGETAIRIIDHPWHFPPHFYKANSILIKQAYALRAGVTPENLIIEAYLGSTPGNDSYSLYEDDGMTQHWEKDEFANTEFNYAEQGGRATVTINPTVGDFNGLPSKRSYQIRIIGKSFASASLNDGTALPFTQEDDAHYTEVSLNGISIREGATVVFE